MSDSTWWLPSAVLDPVPGPWPETTSGASVHVPGACSHACALGPAALAVGALVVVALQTDLQPPSSVTLM